MSRSPASAARTQLVLIVAIALASLGGAYLLFYLATAGGLWGTTNHGTFVDPPTTVAELQVRTASGAAFETDGKWWLWVVPDGPCSDPCREALHQLRQIHVLLNRDAPRVRRALIVREPAGNPDIGGSYPRLAMLSGNLGILPGGIYVVDPIGNLVFHYRMERAGEPVLDDLKRLLKVSQIG